MPIAIDPRVEATFVLPSDKNEAKPTVFRLRPLTEVAMLKIHALNPDPTAYMVALAEEALVGWSDFYDSAGKAVAFRRGDLSRLTSPAIMDIGEEVWRLNKITDREAKN